MGDLIGQHIGQYEIRALLGEGGVAVVYRAYQPSIRREVAIKVIKPNLVKMSDFGQQDDMVYLVMELLTGGSLVDEIRRGSLSLSRISKLLDHMTSALDHAHSRGIIHRDLVGAHLRVRPLSCHPE